MEDSELIRIEGLILPQFVQKSRKRSKVKKTKAYRLLKIDKKKMAKKRIKEIKKINELRKVKYDFEGQRRTLTKEIKIMEDNKIVIKEFMNETFLALLTFGDFREARLQFLVSQLLRAFSGGLTVDQKLVRIEVPGPKDWIQSSLIGAGNNNDIIPAEALYDYDAIEEGEIDFKKGDKILIKFVFEDEYGYGKNERTGKEGIFPLNQTSAWDISEKKVEEKYEKLEEKTYEELKEEVEEELKEEPEEPEEKPEEEKPKEEEPKLTEEQAILISREGLQKIMDETNEKIDKINKELKNEQDNLYKNFIQQFVNLKKQPVSKDFEKSCNYGIHQTKLFFGKVTKGPLFVTNTGMYKNISLDYLMRAIWFILADHKRVGKLKERKKIQPSFDEAYKHELKITKEFKNLLEDYKKKIEKHTGIYKKEYEGEIHFENIWDFERIIERQGKRRGKTKEEEIVDMNAKIKKVKKKVKRKVEKSEMYEDRFYLRKQLLLESREFEKKVKRLMNENYFVPMFV
jgi:hypothetical protein